MNTNSNKLKEIFNLLEEYFTLQEKMCKRGKNYMAARKRAGEKSSAYLSGRGVKVCKGQIKGSDGKKIKSYEENTLKELFDSIKKLKTKFSPPKPTDPYAIRSFTDDEVKKMFPQDTNEDRAKVLIADRAFFDYHFDLSYYISKHEPPPGYDAAVKKVTTLLDKGEKHTAKVEANKYAKELSRMSADLELPGTDTVENILREYISESLKNWFEKEDWVRIDTAGNITGPCGTMKNKKNPSRCLPKKKAQSLSKKERAATARKKKAAGKKGKQFVKNTKKARVKLKKNGN